ncbi:hypothetical protein [Neolewinella lacunae]|nr:hypothetical protein [Neolewinella lacunae]
MKIILSLIIACISITAYSQSNMELTKSLINKYIEELNLIRGDKNLLKEYRFTNDKSNHFERLRINIALFNDFKQTDFWISKYLFEQESIWRKSEIDYDNEDVDNLYFSALLVSKYQKPEMVIKFFETKMIDFDSSIGFDGEFLLSSGKEETFKYLSESGSEIVNKIYKHIGNSIENCGYKDDDLKVWRDFKYQYFKDYILPIEDPMWFLYSMNEKELLKANFQSWIDSNNEWSESKIYRFRTFSEYLDDRESHIKSLKMILKHNNEPENGESYWAKKLREVESRNEK